MSRYLMTLTPREPYFFGNEKSFQYPGSSVGDARNHYYIASELIPAQTTLIGMLRYVLLPCKKTDRNYSDAEKKQNGDAVGYESFQYDGNTENKFGKILGISPLFLLHGTDRLVVTPFDHSMVAESLKSDEDKKREEEAKKAGEKFQPERMRYTPFSQYDTFSQVNREGEAVEKCYPLLRDENGNLISNGYNVKEGIAHSYMNVENGEIYDLSEIFSTDTRVGINRINRKNGFFKKDYAVLLSAFAFGAYVQLADDMIPPAQSVVYLGQGKSLFTVQFEEVSESAEQDLMNKIAARLDDRVVYCLADIFVHSDIYSLTKFAVTETRDYRAYMTTAEGRVKKESTLYKLVRAGSVVIPTDKQNFMDQLANSQVSVIGYNTVVCKKEKA